MIRNFKHKGLKELFLNGNDKWVLRVHTQKLKSILIKLEQCTDLSQLKLPGLNLHKLQGNRKDYYSVTVSANWRVIFKFDGKDVLDVEYLDYH